MNWSDRGGVQDAGDAEGKLSGFRWTKGRCRVILDLRAALLNEAWKALNRDVSAAMPNLNG